MDQKALGQRIQMFRKQRDLSQEKVEQVLGLPQKAMTHIESGERHISTLELAKLAELFKVALGDFLNDYLSVLDLDLDVREKNHSVPRELKIYLSYLIIEAYRQEKISRGRVMELSKLLHISGQKLLEISKNESS